MKKVLILCTGNSCRSIMAEAMINHYLKDKWIAYSAGVSPTHVHPRSIQMMQELGIDISTYRSKSVTEFLQRDDLDLVITVCDHARETCPLFLNPARQIHIGIEDPVLYSSAPEEAAVASFRQVRTHIYERIVSQLDSL